MRVSAAQSFLAHRQTFKIRCCAIYMYSNERANIFVTENLLQLEACSCGLGFALLVISQKPPTDYISKKGLTVDSDIIKCHSLLEMSFKWYKKLVKTKFC